MNFSLQKAEILIQKAQGKTHTRLERIEHTITLASFLIEAASYEITAKEEKRERRVSHMMQDANSRTFMTAVTDRCFRSQSSEKTADQLVYLINQFGVPKFLTTQEYLGFKMLPLLKKKLATFFTPFIRKKLRQEMANVLLPENLTQQKRYFRKCWQDNRLLA